MNDGEDDVCVRKGEILHERVNMKRGELEMRSLTASQSVW